jgi:hypothetical protein
MLKVGDQLVVERKTGYRTFGYLVEENESGVFIEGTVGDNTGDIIFIRWENVDQIRVRK